MIKRDFWSNSMGRKSMRPLLRTIGIMVESAPINRSKQGKYLVYDLLHLITYFVRNAYERDALTEYTLEDMLGWLDRIEGMAQDISEEDEETRERIQATTIDLCATLVALQQQGKTFLDENELRKRITCYMHGIRPRNIERQGWLPTQSYDAALAVLHQSRPGGVKRGL